MNRKTKLSLVVVIALVLGAMMFLRNKSTETTVSETESEKTTEQHDHDHDHDHKPAIPKVAPTTSTPSTDPKELSVKMTELPSLRDLEGLTDEEVHHTPDFIVEGGMKIGQLIDEANANPAKREETLKFMKSCAENDDLVPAIRAVCWKKTLTQINNWEIFLPISDAKVSDEVKNLAAQLP
ncbi:hypothetical protein [Peredibacter starrii]|uniref:DUF4476 domain-containing protein n=1 Tax=Peredibacter starrii TaxID=28202 RepID=A0AAX4HNK9_9BACT|nr:hypothetical protein [Peredibacter starrii]WPU64757.1 hypothetical protein SOO65_18855 [Peredibacter starrii]